MSTYPESGTGTSMPGLELLTTQKASAALGAAVIGPMVLEPLVARVVPVGGPWGGVIAGVGLAWLGAAMLDGHLESIAIGAGVGLAAKALFQQLIPQVTA